MSSIIFYGAGKHAVANFNRWSAKGIVPVCFADQDESKHFKEIDHIGEGIYCYPLDYALSKWPDSDVYLTVGSGSLGKITDWLIKEKGTERERIKYPDPMEWRMGCQFLGSRIQFFGDRFATCCANKATMLPYSEDFDANLRQYHQHCGDLLSDLRFGEKTPCENCAQLHYDLWPVEPRLEVIGFDTAFQEDTCNFNCIYCGVKKNMNSKLYKQNLLGLLHEFEKRSVGEYREIVLASGEISVSAYCDEVLGIIAKNQWDANIFTNASVFNQKLADLMSLGLAYIHVSMDAGTQETFATVKGLDCWNKVTDNLAKYAYSAKFQNQISLKYIILPGINDNAADADGFVELASKLKAMVFISSDANNINEPLNEHTLNIALRLVRGCKQRNIRISLVSEFFNPSSHEQLLASL
jgi:pyruvate-formate lyase-activating enzyme